MTTPYNVTNCLIGLCFPPKKTIVQNLCLVLFQCLALAAIRICCFVQLTTVREERRRENIRGEEEGHKESWKARAREIGVYKGRKRE